MVTKKAICMKAALGIYVLFMGRVSAEEDMDHKKCLDYNPECRRWANQGMCDLNGVYMHVYCSESCGTCKFETCVDKTEDCAYWSSQGECLTNPLFMVDECKQSCGYCIRKDPEPKCKWWCKKYHKKTKSKSCSRHHFSCGTCDFCQEGGGDFVKPRKQCPKWCLLRKEYEGQCYDAEQCQGCLECNWEKLKEKVGSPVEEYVKDPKPLNMIKKSWNKAGECQDWCVKFPKSEDLCSFTRCHGCPACATGFPIAPWPPGSAWPVPPKGPGPQVPIGPRRLESAELAMALGMQDSVSHDSTFV